MPRERILVYGGPKVGKSTCWLQIAEKQPDAKFYVVDTDCTTEPMLAGPYSHLKNVEVFEAYDWLTLKEAGQKVLGEAVKGDWIIIDMISTYWKAVQNYFSEQTQGVDDVAEYLLSLRIKSGVPMGSKGADVVAPAAGWDWSLVNRLYDSAIKPVLFTSHAHVFAATEEKDVPDSGPGSQEKQRMWGRIGSMPEGQKALGYQFNSIIQLSRTSRNRYLTTMERAKEELDKEVLENFWTDYMVKVSGWK